MRETILYENLQWINIENPTQNDLNYLATNFQLHLVNIEDILFGVHQSKADIYKKYIFFMLHYPNYENSVLKIEELNIFLGDKFLITISNGKLEILKKFFNECQIEKNAHKFFIRGLSNIVYVLIDKLTDSYFSTLKNIGKEIENIDNILTQKISAPYLIEKISDLRRDSVLIHTAVKPQISLFVKLIKQQNKFLNKELKTYWENLIDHLEKILSQTEDYLELIDGLARAYESLVSYKTNEIIRILTIFSAILLPLNFIVSIYGMNIDLPLAEKKYAFLIISLIMLGIMAILIIFFKKRKWL